ncbi:MAG: hypothetical protein AAF567_18965 [Actinomycetota bacterium]
MNASFFEDLDRELPSERGPLGQPSSIDFRSIELMEIVERFATGFDSIPRLFQGRDDYRVLVKHGVLVRGIETIGVLASDGAVELIGLELDLRMDWE